jgi:hypothetical protein
LTTRGTRQLKISVTRHEFGTRHHTSKSGPSSSNN